MMNFGLVIIFLVLLTHALFTDSKVKYLEKRKWQFNKSDAPRCRTVMAASAFMFPVGKFQFTNSHCPLLS